MRLTMRSRLSVSLGIEVVGRWSFVVGLAYVGFFANDQRLRANDRFPYGLSFNAALVQLALKDSFHVNAGGVNLIGLQLAYLDQVFNLGNGDLRGGRHHG